MNDDLILIQSSDSDQSTFDVIEWLLNKNQNILILKCDMPIVINEITLKKNEIDISFDFNSKTFLTKNIKSFWYRKGDVLFNPIDPTGIGPQTMSYIKEETAAIQWYFINELDRKAKINSIKNSDINKLFQLRTAMECGLNVPSTLLSNQVAIIKKFIKIQGSVITKSIQVPFFIRENGKFLTLMTSNFRIEDLNKIPKEFLMTKFQKEIKKKYELRIFFIDEEFYPMAIFSQGNVKTETDFRNYDLKMPNRTVPYSLPKNLKQKLTKIMSKLDLRSGSIDILVDTNDEYYFLEVNPVGQFGMVSSPCNYYLEETIANLLTN